MKFATHCYIRNHDETLMLYRNKKEKDIHKGYWMGLGGKIENGESPEECIIREIQEESGLLIHQPILKGFVTFPDFMGDDDWYMFLYEAYCNEKKTIECKEGTLAWIPTHDIKKLPMLSGDHLLLFWLNIYSYFSAKLCYEKEHLKKIYLYVQNTK